MNKRGIALIFALLVTVVLAILLNSFFIKAINENNAVKRYVNSVKALWAAEAGVADAKKNLPNSPNDDNLGSCQYQTITSFRTTIGANSYYDITSTGTAPFTSGGEISKTINVIAKMGAADPSKFKYGLGAANDLCFGGASCNKDADDFLDPEVCNGVPCWKEFDATINFADMFGHSQAEVEAVATHYTEANFPGVVSGVTWVDVTPGQALNVGSSATGSGILIVEGDAQFEGSYQFHGIIYVLGTLRARGTFDSYGSTVVASGVGVDSVNGTPEFHYNVGDITSALQQLASNFSSIVSWKEGS